MKAYWERAKLSGAEGIHLGGEGEGWKEDSNSEGLDILRAAVPLPTGWGPGKLWDRCLSSMSFAMRILIPCEQFKGGTDFLPHVHLLTVQWSLATILLYKWH